DKLVGDLAAKGIRVLPIMWGSPKWVAPSTITPPLDTQAARSAWQSFLKGAMDPPSPTVYARLLDLSHSAINGVDRHANVMIGGLLGHSPTGPAAWTFLDRVYGQPGAKKDFDVAA